MAQLVIAAAGAVVGGLIGGPQGAQAGWLIGSAIGGAFAPGQHTNVEGPKLSDLKVTGTEYGQPIPWVAGTPRLAGQLIWSSDRRQIAHTTTTSSGGKGGGGGGQSVTSTSYTYDVDLLFLLTDNEIPGVTRIWDNGKLIYNVGGDADTIAASTDTPRWERITVYTGAADQLPDPTYEAAIGSANAPAYRGRGTAFIESLHLGVSGTIPNLTFEIGTPEGTVVALLHFDGTDGSTSIVDTTARHVWTRHGSAQIDTAQSVSGGASLLLDGSSYATAPDSADWHLTADFTIEGRIRFSAVPTAFGSPGPGNECIFGQYQTSGNQLSFNLYCSVEISLLRHILVFAYSFDGVNENLAGAVLPTNFVTNQWYHVAVSRRGSSLRFFLDGALLATVTVSGALFDSSSPVAIGASLWGGVREYFNGWIDEFRLNNGAALYTSSFSLASPFPTSEINYPSLESVVADLCDRAGLTTDQYDATGLSTITKPVRALAVSQISPTRTTLDMLMAAFYFELTVSDKLYFRPRGGASVVTIPYADLGASLGGNAVEPFAIHQRTDIELPSQISITYANTESDYQTDTQISDRMVTATTGTVQDTQMALGMTAAEAKGIADTAALDQQVALVDSSIALLGTYARLEPTDPITVIANDGSSFRLRIVNKKDSYPLLEFDVVMDDASVLIEQGITSTDYASSTVVAAAPATLIELMDIPILRDADNDAGIYVAAKGATDPWPGANIYSSSDDVTYIFEDTVEESALFGSCTTTLGDWTGPRLFDETNSVTIDIGAGTTASVTRAEILADQLTNCWLIGSEIIQARDATLVTTGVYKLTGLLRGCRGTEWAMTGHAAAERCVRLQAAGLRRIETTTTALGSARDYKGVTLGGSASGIIAESFTDNGVGLKPFSPVDLRASRNGSGDIAFTWRRRTRLATRTTGPLGISVPLGEESEAYDILIYADGTYASLLRTLSATTNTVNYTSAQQTTDFGSNQATVYARIYQRSARVGRGYPLEAAA